MNDIKIYIKLLEDSGILIDGVTESVKHEKKTRRLISVVNKVAKNTKFNTLKTKVNILEKKFLMQLHWFT